MVTDSVKKRTKRRWRRAWSDGSAVSPVIGTILMVAITVVLAGVLVVIISDQGTTPSSNVMVGMDAQMIEGDWVVKVLKLQHGTIAGSEASIQIVNASSGAATVSYPLNGIGIGDGDGSNFDYHDNNNDGFINPGDAFHIYRNQNVSNGHSFKLFKGRDMVGHVGLN